MSKFFRISVFILIVLALPATLPAQSKKAEAADAAFKNMMYNTAIKKYKKAYSKVKDKGEKNRILFQLSECYRIVNDNKMGEGTYKRLFTVKYDTIKPEILLHYANMVRYIGKYDVAIEYYQKYLALFPEDVQAKNGLKSCEIAPEILKYPTRHQVTNEKQINSKDDDFSPAYTNSNLNELIFTSTRTGVKGKTKDNWTNQGFSDLFTTKKDAKGKWNLPVTADETGNVNTEGNEGTPFFNGRFNSMYFTRCPNETKMKNGCQVFVSKRAGQGFSESTVVSLGKDSTAAVGHPTLSSDELTIIFSAVLPNGKGGRDLWMATREKKNDKFGTPKNLGDSINTPGDELFPHLRNDSTLYFASNGHPGLGGLDIFKSYFLLDSLQRRYFTAPRNMGVPINSNNDDFGIVFSPDAEEEGYFTSNRKGGKGGDDIFSFYVEPVIFTLQGIVKDERTLQVIPGALVECKVSDGKSHKSTTSDKGAYSFNKNQIKANRIFELSVSKDGYFSTTGRETTVGLESSRDLVHDFILQPIPKKPIVLPDILYDLGKWDLKPQYQDSLQGLITTLQSNATITIELAAHTDARDSEERNDILSQKRAQSVVDYLIVRGIDPDRLTAKGYGERVPRTLQNQISRGGYTFKAGARLTEGFIDSLPSKDVKELAHQLNRRTEFSITGTNFVPKKRMIVSGDPTYKKKIDVVVAPQKNIVNYTMSKKRKVMMIPASIDGYNQEFMYDPKASTPIISMELALELLKNGRISKDDFHGQAEELLSEGSIKRGAVITLPSIKIGKKAVYDIDVTVEPKAEEALILNNSVLSRFGAFTLNEETLELIFE